MVKIIFILIFSTLSLFGLNPSAKKVLKQNCLNCHHKQQIPSELLYRRYLSKYSTQTAMFFAIKHYLKKPNKSQSIMPSQFFLKFPIRPEIHLKEKELKQSIYLFLKYFDVKKKLKLSPKA